MRRWRRFIKSVIRPMLRSRSSLHPYGVCGLDFKELEQQEKKYVKKYFKEQILPLLSPQIVDANHPFPHLLNKELYVTASLKLR